MLREAHPRSVVLLSLLFAAFVLFLYGPTLTITVLSFQGPTGGLVFPMQG
jgi:putative spermidine/putrescine transport system permease protein